MGRGAKVLFASVAVSLLAACTQVKPPAAEPYLSATTPPERQELRWSNGKLPRSFDPARAAAAPESDIVCALYEGLTEIDIATLNPVPAAAEKWTVSDEGRTWTFQLRKDAKWSNGKRVTADEFASSWRRAAALRGAPHPELFENIVGLAPKPQAVKPADEPRADAKDRSELPEAKVSAKDADNAATPGKGASQTKPADDKKAPANGIEVLDDSTLRVTLIKADADFAKIVADPAFRPVYGDGANFDAAPLDAAIVTNVDADHLDTWGTEEAYSAAFDDFAATLDPAGFLVVVADDPGAAALGRRHAAAGRRVVTV